ncbi:hypothetical protein Taro_053915 [Colocasia esculenta]|uniref:Uncharacterized protein n=1 Tax=Colocasia esculenta TaxID=4460 RepID=A0A843XPI1_COLES|nr:hypothetical protein [Colocasia esculenta]
MVRFVRSEPVNATSTTTTTTNFNTLLSDKFRLEARFADPPISGSLSATARGGEVAASVPFPRVGPWPPSGAFRSAIGGMPHSQAVTGCRCELS